MQIFIPRCSIKFICESISARRFSRCLVVMKQNWKVCDSIKSKIRLLHVISCALCSGAIAWSCSLSSPWKWASTCGSLIFWALWCALSRRVFFRLGHCALWGFYSMSQPFNKFNLWGTGRRRLGKKKFQNNYSLQERYREKRIMDASFNAKKSYHRYFLQRIYCTLVVHHRCSFIQTF